MEKEGERYLFIQKSSGLNKSEFAASLGISKAYGYQIATGRAKAPRQTLQRLALEYRINLNWYLYGQGEPGAGDEVAIELLEQEAAAGHGREVDEYVNKHTLRLPMSLISPYKPEKLQAVRVSGDSMTGVNIHNGDVVVFYPGLIQGNGIYVVSVENTLLVKQVEFDGPGQAILLISANPAYEPRRYSGHELENIRVTGRVVACYHKM
ncbi:MAG: transcriptional regulator [Treponema sp.]|jgi:phage repressor protein C with HTH and peptisase S24 domain|nr:transcriptional regulator [Treponema sp.]